MSASSRRFGRPSRSQLCSPRPFGLLPGASGSRRAGGDQHDVGQRLRTTTAIMTYRLTVSPAAEPRPALRYRFLVPPVDQIHANAATFYYKALVMDRPRLDGSVGCRRASAIVA